MFPDGVTLVDGLSPWTSGGLAFDGQRRVSGICDNPAQPPPSPNQGDAAILRFSLKNGVYGLTLYYCGAAVQPAAPLGWSVSGPGGGMDSGTVITVTGP